MYSFARCVLLFLLICKSLNCQAQENPGLYDKTEYMIPMRDGVRLHSILFSPKQKTGPLPFLVTRTPYGINHTKSPEMGFLRDLALDGYYFVWQDIRGRNQSEGVFDMFRPMRNKKDPKATDESTDAWDTIEWLLQNIPGNNGKAGMFGISYDGWTTAMAAADPHPALIAVSEQATPADMFLGDDFFHNGAFRLSYALEYVHDIEGAGKNIALDLPQKDTYEWYLKLGPLSNVNSRYFHDRLPTWNHFVQHPTYDTYWKKQSLASVIDSPKLYIQHVAGWWDQEDFYGPMKAYALWEKKDKLHRNYLVVGPWNHGGWAHGTGKKLGNIDFASRTSVTFRINMQKTWFAYHLKGMGDGQFPEVQTFQTGKNVWKTYDSWPVKSTTPVNLYMEKEGVLSFTKPRVAKNAFDSYRSDPDNPVPYRKLPIQKTMSNGSGWFNWLTEDQRFVSNRPDVLSWQTPILTEDLMVTGNIRAKLFASTTGSDADWVVKLIDVYPADYPEDSIMAGYQFMVANEVLRGRFRNGFERAEPVTPGKIAAYPIDLHSIDHVFRKGHRIMVQVQSTWFPLIDRNPQKFVPNIFEAQKSDFQQATHRIYRTALHPSHIQLSVVK